MSSTTFMFGRSAEETEQYLEELERRLNEKMADAAADPEKAKRFAEAILAKVDGLERI